MSVDAILDALDGADVEYALIGAAARNVWAPPRATTDLDLAALVDATGHARLVSALAGIGYAVARTHRTEPSDPVPAVTIFRNTTADRPYRQVDVLAAATPFEREAVGTAVERPFGERPARVIRREYLIISKLIAWRARDRQDVVDVLETARAAGVELDIALLERWAQVWQVEDRLSRALEGAEL